MTLPLKKLNAIQALAHAVQDFLPGSGAREWRAHVTFGTVADRAGVGDFWTPQGSKVPRLVQLFEFTLEHRPRYFEPLIIGIVKEGLLYRRKNRRPVTDKEIKIINGHIADIGFKFRELWDTDFLNAIRIDDATRAYKNVERAERDEEQRVSEREQHRRSLAKLMSELENLFVQSERQRAGLALEKLLNRLFKLFELEPREPFRIVGEQIDGSFELDHEIYLLEAKWEKAPIPEKELLVFHAKIEGKSSFTRGVFIAMNGITNDAETAIRIGKQPLFFVITGHDLMMILQGAIPLDSFLRARFRLLAEEAAVTATFDRITR